MNRQRRDLQQRAIDANQLRLELVVTGLDNYTTSNRQVTVEPSVPQATTIALNTDLSVYNAIKSNEWIYGKANSIEDEPARIHASEDESSA
jgi:hypothetical protein